MTAAPEAERQVDAVPFDLTAEAGETAALPDL